MSKRETIFAKKFLSIGSALLILMGGILGFSTVAYAAGEQVVIPDANERNITIAASQSVFIAPNIELNNFGFQIESAKVVIENLPSDASTTYTDVSGLTVVYDSEKMVYTITGTANASVYQTLFRSFKITSGTTLRNDIKFNFLVSENTTTPMYYSGTGHYYEYISRGTAPRIDWTDAVAAASGMTYNGMEGYMVTITSAGENAFVVNKMAESGWIGASDPTATGVWKWATGPEAGTQFWQGYRPGSAVGGQYNNWQSGEPNKDSLEENYAHIILEYPNFIPGEWNDMADSNDFVKGYVVEYGGMPGDAPEDFDETVTVNIGASVIYNANGATSGTVPTDNSSPYVSGSTVNVLTNSGTLAKTDFAFSGWNTQSDGQGTHYDATGADSFTISSNIRLYAEWDCNVTYDANGATSGTVPTDSNAPYNAGSSVTVLINSGTLEKTGYAFSGWNTQSDGQGTHYDATGSTSFTISSNVTLYAEWDCNVTYDANGATSGTVPTDSNAPYNVGSSVTVLTNSGTLEKTGYAFSGWNTQSDGQGTHYDATGSASFTISSNVTLYAEWGCSVTYNLNGATSGTVPTDNSSLYVSGSTVTVLDNSGTLEKTGYIFDGWNTQSDGQGTHYDEAGFDSFGISANVILYAEWARDTDYDGVSDEDEVSAGTSPNDPGDRPQKGTINVTVYQQDGSPASGFTCVLNSTPVVVTTDANGTAIFSNVDLAPHTLTLRNGSVQLGIYSLDFTKGSANSTNITDNASTDSDGSVSNIVSSNFQSLNLTIQRNGSNFWQIGYASNTQSPSSVVNYGKVENPQTGDYHTNFNNLWMLVTTAFIGAYVAIFTKLKKKTYNGI